MRRTPRPGEQGEHRKKPVTLEELAARLHDARLPRSTGSEPVATSTEDFSSAQSPIIVTETIARIYMTQGSYELAIEAFKTLQQQKPEKHGEFEKLIKECERKRS
jgi:lipopolysaccharide biosynthesis regulator YciM